MNTLNLMLQHIDLHNKSNKRKLRNYYFFHWPQSGPLLIGQGQVHRPRSGTSAKIRYIGQGQVHRPRSGTSAKVRYICIKDCVHEQGQQVIHLERYPYSVMAVPKNVHIKLHEICFYGYKSAMNTMNNPRYTFETWHILWKDQSIQSWLTYYVQHF